MASGKNMDREERRKVAMRFFASIPMDLKSLRSMHRERMVSNTGATNKSIKENSVKSGKSSSGKVLAKHEKIWVESDVTKPYGSAVWNQRSKSQKAVQKMRYLKSKSLFQKRVVLLDQSSNIPLSVFSILPYRKHTLSVPPNVNVRRRSRRVSGSRPLSVISVDRISEATLSIEGIQQPIKEEEVSYKSLLEEPPNINSTNFLSSELENPEWKSGSHRTVLTFTSYMVSVIDYAKPTELKKDLNSRFQEKFPQVKITLSKCRALKSSIQRIANAQGLERSVVERSLSYFDRLVMSGKVIKENRCHCAGVCLLLSAKVNSDIRSAETSRLISRIEHGLKVGRHDLVLFEFPVLAALQFTLIDFN